MTDTRYGNPFDALATKYDATSPGSMGTNRNGLGTVWVNSVARLTSRTPTRATA